MAKKTTLSIIIVTWNSASFIKGCLNSLIKETQKPGSEIIVIDNNSSDETTTIIKKAYPQIHLIKNRKNKGFGTANNQGIKTSRGDFILILNPDTIVHHQAIQQMLKFLKGNPKTGMVGPEQLNGKGKIIFNFSRWTIRGVIEYLIEKISPKSKLALSLKTPYKVDGLNGGCWLVKKEVFKRSGLYDERFFLYGEEPDMCKRIKQAGWEIFFLRNTTITHFREGSIKQIGLKKYLHIIRSFLKIFIPQR
ncbi:glycosyltransferase family 2 protein [Candidatus Shapirobacteria bacterium]|nr:glycosyltransferase family 2 protein [Candidatus Shapirobacteria bacterium]